jgi:lipopolysaccharide heptosyltransferase II
LRILIVKLHAVGDVIMALPMVTALRKRYPNARITWLCGETTAPIIRLMRGVEVIAVNEANLFHGSPAERIAEMAKAWVRLLGRRFDLILTAYADPRYRLVTLTARSKERRKTNRGKGRWWAVAGRYQADEYVRLATNVDGPKAERAELPVIRPPLTEKLRSLTHGTAQGLVAIAPGGAKNTSVDSPLRRWPIESYRRLAAELLRRGFRVAITGAPSDAWARPNFEGLPVIDLIGRTSLVDLLALYGACAGVVTHDSGPLHIAILADACTVALFGPTIPQEKVPSRERIRVLWGGEALPCCPCWDGKLYAPCTENVCLQQISVDMVIDALDELIGGPRSGVVPARAPLMATVR